MQKRQLFPMAGNQRWIWIKNGFINKFKTNFCLKTFFFFYCQESVLSETLQEKKIIMKSEGFYDLNPQVKVNRNVLPWL